MGARVSIGDFAVMTSLSRKALRHYHDIGILEPTHIDPQTGYRFYDTSQVDHAHIIRRFRSLGMSIPDIKALLSTEDAAARTEIITTHLEQMEVQLAETRDAVGALRELLSPVRTPAHVEVQHKPAFAVWSVGATIDVSDIDDWFGVALQILRDAVATADCAHLGFEPGGLYDRALFLESHGSATLFVSAPHSVLPPKGVRAEILAPAEFAVLTHSGGHDGIDRSYGALGSYVNEHLISHQGPIREHYTGATSSNPMGFNATEICWPIFSTASPAL
ncbi:MerR family transcriptional regulator [Mycobacteroides abscessus]|uniref:MerR family transcriptional regulator n=1 Tax=Mycobacteroides abscessus subsp. massiliense TaxID=1962118 RepID=A0A1T6EHR1_9MYCO|nr:MerR family transcriptional regulator [Mycobacteroides abscessus]AMU66019.1 MerR family transcriptional regulator [Mycobacteroides abscessus]ARQ64835.1 MerR family transcriptional regulator [Mycobacteroides abscessus subsp. massiliense]EHM17941.1 MerR family transcriptional regulator [Mycobacteroides abscessus subsp. massiliense CCUG 48898 = JCM 15300]EIV63619.1 transcriptional regulator, MerR family [Mycobacteroides abscessus subsp. massiliense CCUG 48898 = JCM 15300]MBE5404335.1 hypotheti